MHSLPLAIAAHRLSAQLSADGGPGGALSGRDLVLLAPVRRNSVRLHQRGKARDLCRDIEEKI